MKNRIALLLGVVVAVVCVVVGSFMITSASRTGSISNSLVNGVRSLVPWIEQPAPMHLHVNDFMQKYVNENQ